MKGKTVLKKKVLNKPDEPAMEKENGKIKIIKDKTSLGKKKLNSKKKEKNNSQQLIEQIIITYFSSTWQNKILAMKNRVSSRPDKKSKDLRNLFRKLNYIISYHKYLYLMELFDIMSNMPMPEGVEHDSNYGKIFLVKGKQKPVEKEIEVENENENEIVITEGNLRGNKNKENDDRNQYKSQEEDELDKELAMYLYRSDGKTIDRVEIEKDINRLIDEYPDKDIDVERILNSKRLQYKLKHPRFSPFTKKENLDSFIRYLYTYKPEKSGKLADNVIVLKNKTYAYY